jgi:hypothetical protein
VNDFAAKGKREKSPLVPQFRVLRMSFAVALGLLLQVGFQSRRQIDPRLVRQADE